MGPQLSTILEDAVAVPAHHVHEVPHTYHSPAGQDAEQRPMFPGRSSVTAHSPETPFWPNLKFYLSQANPTTPPPKPCCTLCTRPLAIPFLPRPHHAHDNHTSSPANEPGTEPGTKPPPHAADPAKEEAAILPCGHLFGAACFARLAASHHARGTPAHCPACYLQLAYTNPVVCPHPLQPFILSAQPIAHARAPGIGGILPAVPRTIPEGGRMPAACPGCRVFHAWRYLRMAEGMLFDAAAGYGNGAGEMGWEAVTGRDYSGLVDSRAAVLGWMHATFGNVVCAAHVGETVRPTWAGLWPMT
ncbi:hypothetical protein BT67DRAFT_438389 [Trichocladium antarcticum]|uniref:RING-type domain-containing protein n=1 Tax=Trichocladium antarcticum TaxID=1450529 RepID=A0AAN6UR12_9PEZI|nr:hypothetical protein BT67DRAFT_438389 [Trichocladium antarcticum]